MSTAAPTWIACLTPPGQGALATLGVVGPRAWEAVAKVFRLRSGNPLTAPAAGHFWLGRMGEDVADEVVVAVKQMVPVPFVEVHSHGGRQVVRFLTDLLLAQGLQLCTWQELLRATTEGPLTAVAAMALTEALTTRTAGILLDQYAGALARALDAILAALDDGDANAACRQLDELLRYAPPGLHLCRPWRVVVAGAPNVGKSSLVNALAGYQRSIVSPVPGTTRDVVTVQLAVDGWPIEVADTAGMRSSESSLEEEGVKRARTAAAAADLCLWVLDASAEPLWPGAKGGPVHLVVNKVDLPPGWDLSRAGDAVRVSAATGAGLPELCSFLAGRLVSDAPPPGAAVPFTAALVQELAAIRERVAAGDVAAGRTLLRGLRCGDIGEGGGTTRLRQSRQDLPGHSGEVP